MNCPMYVKPESRVDLAPCMLIYLICMVFE